MIIISLAKCLAKFRKKNLNSQGVLHKLTKQNLTMGVIRKKIIQIKFHQLMLHNLICLKKITYKEVKIHSNYLLPSLIINLGNSMNHKKLEIVVTIKIRVGKIL